MRRSRWGWVAALGTAAIATVVGLWFVTAEVETLEMRQAQSQAEFARAETIRLALWRMDSWLTPRLAREAARPPAEYAAFYAPSGTVNRLLQSVPQGEVLSPSPLLIETAPWIPVHFELRSDGTLTSPQIPTGNLLDLAEGQFLKDGVSAKRQQALRRVGSLLAQAPQSLDACVEQAESSAKASGAAAEPAWTDSKSSKVFISEQQQRAKDDYETRSRVSNQAQQSAQAVVVPEAAGGGFGAGAGGIGGGEFKGRGKRSKIDLSSATGKQVQTDSAVLEVAAGDAQNLGAQVSPPQQPSASDTSVGPLVATWLSADPPELVFVRRVREHGVVRLQGFLVDWPILSSELLGQVSDLMSAARLEPAAAASTDFVPSRLASVPADLHGDISVAGWNASSASSTPAVVFAWIAALLALASGAVAAWAGISFGDRQARFASSVTHELRTPLTTFQLYAEMLRDGMVPDETRRRECLETLCRESTRLSHLVENVLSLSRMERGVRKHESARTVSAGELESLLSAIAHERANGSHLSVHSALGNCSLRLELDAVTQVLANLIENAAKYGRTGDSNATITVSLEFDGTAFVARVCDSGPGINSRDAAAIWRPFDRAGAESGTQPGLGLGLSVSLALTKSMNGSLRLVERTSGENGACFELRIPAAKIA